MKLIFKLASSGSGLRSIATELRKRGALTRAGRPWNNVKLHKILTIWHTPVPCCGAGPAGQITTRPHSLRYKSKTPARRSSIRPNSRS
ncbi:MAG: recombinase family protein [Chloroflexi bacterium]|nr:recombinase family protein [Chloroflexota bacterium]